LGLDAAEDESLLKSLDCCRERESGL
jgi:hypothetical protein